jgi:hypothetical protein
MQLGTRPRSCGLRGGRNDGSLLEHRILRNAASLIPRRASPVTRSPGGETGMEARALHLARLR